MLESFFCQLYGIHSVYDLNFRCILSVITARISYTPDEFLSLGCRIKANCLPVGLGL